MSHQIPTNLFYTKEHEWIKIEGENAVIGITDFAQSALGDVVFVELPDAGESLTQNQSFGVVESIKSVSDLYAPLSGLVLAKNSEVESTPELCNKDCYSNWLVKIKFTSQDETKILLNAESYKQFCASL